MRQINYIIIHCSATNAGRDFYTRNIDKIINLTLSRLVYK